jgi:hypothetical protein
MYQSNIPVVKPKKPWEKTKGRELPFFYEEIPAKSDIKPTQELLPTEE